MASVRAARPIVSRHSESSFTVRLHANPTQPTLALWGVERDAPAKGELYYLLVLLESRLCVDHMIR